MRLLGKLLVALSPFAAVAWLIVRDRAFGAQDGVVWCLALVAVVVGFCVIGSEMERRFDQ